MDEGERERELRAYVSGSECVQITLTSQGTTSIFL